MFIMSSMVVLGSEISMGSSVVSESLGWGKENRSLKKGDAKHSIFLRTGISTPSDVRRTTRSFDVDIATLNIESRQLILSKRMDFCLVPKRGMRCKNQNK